MDRPRELKPFTRILLLILLTLTVICITQNVGDAVVFSRVDPSFTTSLPIYADPHRPLKIMTFNMRHAEGEDGQVDLERVAELLRNTDADVIALQEVDRFKKRSQYKDQPRELADRLHMEWRFAASLEEGRGQYGIALLSRYPIVDSSILKMPGSREPRCLLEATLKIADETIRIVNTHLGVELADRLTQMPLLVQRVATYPGPTVLMGDWNMSADDPILLPIATRWTLLPLHAGISTVRDGRQIDHIFINFPDSGKTALTEPTAASDHQPVLAQLAWP